MADSYTLRDLITAASTAERLSLSERIVRQYVADGLLPPPRGQGIAATYTSDHLAHLRMVLRLANQYVPLPEIRHWMGALTTAQLHALLERPALPRLPVEGDAQAYLHRLLKSLPPAAMSTPLAGGGAHPPQRQQLRKILRAHAPAGTKPDSTLAAERWIMVHVSPDVRLMVRDGTIFAHDPLVQRLSAAVREILTDERASEH